MCVCVRACGSVHLFINEEIKSTEIKKKHRSSKCSSNSSSNEQCKEWEKYETKMKRIKVMCVHEAFMVKKKSENNTQSRTRLNERTKKTEHNNRIMTIKKRRVTDNANGNDSQRHVTKNGIKKEPCNTHFIHGLTVDRHRHRTFTFIFTHIFWVSNGVELRTVNYDWFLDWTGNVLRVWSTQPESLKFCEIRVNFH